jgi:hypothetical protein
MSSSYPYFTPLEDPQFSGEMPLPDAVGDADSGVSILKANADHTHLIEIGGETNPWQDVLFGAGWFNWAVSTNRTCQYSRIGNIAFLRGAFGAPNPANLGATMGTIPIDFCPKNGVIEVFVVTTGGAGVGAQQIWVHPNGAITWHGPSTNPQWVSVAAIFWSID